MCFPVALAVGRLPISIDGFGVREVVLVHLFSLVGVPGGEALLIGLANQIGRKLAETPGALCFLWLQKREAVAAEVGQSGVVVPGDR